MVCRIVSQPHGRVAFFLRAWGLYLLLIVLVCLALESWLDFPSLQDLGGIVALLVFFAAFQAWLTLRAWTRIGRFSHERRESFLTMVDAGLLIESPAKGLSFYLPWKGLRYRCRGNMLQFFSGGSLRFLLFLNGVSAEKRKAVLAELQAHTGQTPGGRGFFAAEKAVAPFAPEAEAPAPPHPVQVPPPTPVTAGSSAHYTNDPRQWKEYLGLALRPDWQHCLLYLIGLSGLSLGAGAFAWSEQWAVAGLFVLGAAFLFRRILCPPRSYPMFSGPIRMVLNASELTERWEDGSWARFRLTAANTGNLIRLPHVWCLERRGEPGAFLFDAGQELPPQLAACRRVPAPRNHLRALAGLAAALLGGAYGYFLFELPEEPDAAQRAFHELVAEVDASALRAFVEEHYAEWPLHEAPQLKPCPRRDGQGLAGYILSFTEEEPAPQEAQTCHLLLNWVRLYPDGGLHDWERGPSPQCRCSACVAAREAEPEEDE